MSYHILTGATGLLGSYLLRDGLVAGRQMAVIVRSSIVENARQRIESILARWEVELGRVLPRPPVLEGDICQPDLGLDAAAQRWVSQNCVGMLHNAASLSFKAEPRTGEPYHSNVDGTRNVLEFCRKSGIRQYHHVSTAYVCGLRTGQVLESELDVGQQLGNDYEQSKIQAERMVRQADYIDAATVYRPSIIVGDAISGYTTTFHGFYTPLKIAQALVEQLSITEIDGSPLMAALGLSGAERKNFVPVDWVSRVITDIYGRPEHHGRTYHITSGAPVTVEAFCRVLEEAVRGNVRTGSPREVSVVDFSKMLEMFIEQMETYRAYWRDDPQFDRRNMLEAVPDLPCPEMSFDVLLRTAQYALQTNFGWPRPQPILPAFDAQPPLVGKMPLASDSSAAQQVEPTAPIAVGVQVNGPGGGQWTALVEGNRLVAMEMGLAPRRQALLYLNSITCQKCADGQLTPELAIQRGMLVVEGARLSPDQLAAVLRPGVGNALKQDGASDAGAGSRKSAVAAKMSNDAKQPTVSRTELVQA
jgi:thioester reductase-like protein